MHACEFCEKRPIEEFLFLEGVRFSGDSSFVGDSGAPGSLVLAPGRPGRGFANLQTSKAPGLKREWSPTGGSFPQSERSGVMAKPTWRKWIKIRDVMRILTPSLDPKTLIQQHRLLHFLVELFDRS